MNDSTRDRTDQSVIDDLCRPEPLAETFALSEKLIQATTPPGSGGLSKAAHGLRKAAGYWLWRIMGRRRGRDASASPGLLATLDHYDKDLEKAQDRIRSLEARVAARDRSAELVAAAEARTQEQRVRAEEAERALAQAHARIEILKDALEVTKATKAGTSPADHRFREAKRAFARMYHPDSGGDQARQTLFAEFWPVLERIEREL
ncbi:MAG: hypothetical protein ACM31L_00100 [Actinomycetota bacterium]